LGADAIINPTPTSTMAAYTTPAYHGGAWDIVGRMTNDIRPSIASVKPRIVSIAFI